MGCIDSAYWLVLFPARDFVCTIYTFRLCFPLFTGGPWSQDIHPLVWETLSRYEHGCLKHYNQEVQGTWKGIMANDKNPTVFNISGWSNARQELATQLQQNLEVSACAVSDLALKQM